MNSAFPCASSFGTSTTTTFGKLNRFLNIYKERDVISLYVIFVSLINAVFYELATLWTVSTVPM